MIVELMNRSGAPPNDNRAFLQRFVQFKKCLVEKQFPQDSTFSYIDRCDGLANFPQIREEFYVRESARSKSLDFVKCSPAVPNPTCEEWMRLPKTKDVAVHYTFSMSDLGKWTAMRAALGSLLESFVVGVLPPHTP